MKIGIGYDVHQLVVDRPLILGGVKVPHNKGLKGHSDADVLLHTIMDAILGALGKGDIGTHFPDNDSAYKDISSMILFDRVIELMVDEGYKIGNIDATVVAQRPKLAPYIYEMKQNIAAHALCEEQLVNVKATTTEWLGFEGEERGISSQAVVLLVEKITNEVRAK